MIDIHPSIGDVHSTAADIQHSNASSHCKLRPVMEHPLGKVYTINGTLQLLHQRIYIHCLSILKRHMSDISTRWPKASKDPQRRRHSLTTWSLEGRSGAEGLNISLSVTVIECRGIIIGAYNEKANVR